MVWDENTHVNEEPNANKHEKAMGFPTQITVSHDMYENQCHFFGLSYGFDLFRLVLRYLFGLSMTHK